MIYGPVQRGGVAQKLVVLAGEVAHLGDDVDSFRRVQDTEEYAGAPQPQIHQGEINIVIAAWTCLESIAFALFAFQPKTHVAKVVARTAALPIAAPVDLLELMQELRGAL